jgi:hypothetical protein
MININKFKSAVIEKVKNNKVNLSFIVVSILLIRIIYIKYNSRINQEIVDLKWPFINILDEKGKKINIVCLRGPLEQEKDKDLFKEFIKQKKLIIGCSSYLSFPNECFNKMCKYKNFFIDGKRVDEITKGWLHPFRDDTTIKSKNKILLSESDFSDNIEKLRNFDISTKKIKYDFICYCPDDEGGCDGWNHTNKNWHLAKKTIEIACNIFNLRGLLVGRKNSDIYVSETKLEKHGMLPFNDFLNKISESRFIIISSYEDASPRVISEAMLLNTPLLVNSDIIGGWKYINKETGLFYNESNISSQIDKMLKMSFNPRKYYLNNHGIKHSGKQLRDFVVKIDSSFSKYKYMGFPVS